MKAKISNIEYTMEGEYPLLTVSFTNEEGKVYSYTYKSQYKQDWFYSPILGTLRRLYNVKDYKKLIGRKVFITIDLHGNVEHVIHPRKGVGTNLVDFGFHEYLPPNAGVYSTVVASL